jgi:hypothetical protein
MHLAQNNDVVQTLALDRSDQSLGKAVLPGRGWCGRLVPNAHGAQSARDDATSNPSLSSSPWMRGAPQSGFSMLIRRINARSAVSICGRPPNGRDFQRQ